MHSKVKYFLDGPLHYLNRQSPGKRLRNLLVCRRTVAADDDASTMRAAVAVVVGEEDAQLPSEASEHSFRFEGSADRTEERLAVEGHKVGEEEDS